MKLEKEKREKYLVALLRFYVSGDASAAHVADAIADSFECDDFERARYIDGCQRIVGKLLYCDDFDSMKVAINSPDNF